MNTVLFSDILLKTVYSSASFREKLEIALALDKLCVDAVELPAIDEPKADALFIKTAAAQIKHSALVCNAGITEGFVDITWQALSGAAHPVLQIALPVSPIQIEYHLGLKPPALIERAVALVTKCRTLCADVEFCALDATRADKDFLFDLLSKVISAGATRVTLCDASGAVMADEAETLFREAFSAVPLLNTVIVGAELSNELGMAGACAAAACKAGATLVKTVASGRSYPNLENITKIICSVAMLGEVNIKQTELHRVCTGIKDLITTRRSTLSPFDFGVKEQDSLTLDKNDDILFVKKAATRLGYDLSDEDMSAIYDQFLRIANKKSCVSSRELEAIIANAALQVPQTYRIINYVVTSGNLISPTAVVRMEKDGQPLQGLSLGDGPVDAAILAIENAVGCHYELDDYQIQAVTEGREAMGSALVKLRAHGKLYSGTGISTDVVGASLRAYVSAVNKIVYEEN